LQARIAPRSLTLEDQHNLSKYVEPFGISLFPRRVAVGSYTLDAEAGQFASQIIASLTDSGITVDNQIAAMLPVGGFKIGIQIEGPPRDAKFMLAVALFLKARTDSAWSIKGDPKTTTALSNVVIWVGVKPAPAISNTIK
jgi:hypothetical protein